MSENEILCINKLTNQLRKELSLEYHYSLEEQKKILLNGYILIRLKDDSKGIYKIDYSQFKSNICNMMEEKLDNIIDDKCRKLIFIYLVSLEKSFTSDLLELEFKKFISKTDIKLYNRRENDIKCYIVTTKNGIYTKESVQLESEIVSDYYDDGIINKDTKIYSDYCSTVDIFANGKEYKITRLHLTTHDGKQNLGWTSLNNSKGELLMKEIINHHTCHINFRYDDQYKSSKVLFDEFLKICHKMNLKNIPEKILIKTFIDLSQNKYTISSEDIMSHLKFNIENEKNKHNMLILKEKKLKDDKIKNYTKQSTIGASALVGLYVLNKSNLVPKSMRKDITKKVLKKGVNTISENLQQGGMNFLLPQLENVIDTIDLDNINDDNSKTDTIKNIGVSLLKGIGLIPSNVQSQTNDNEDDHVGNNEDNTKGNLNENAKEKKSMEEVDNLLNVFQSNKSDIDSK